MIDVTDVDVREFVKKVYDLSRPQGMGMMHFQPGPPPEDIIDHCIHEDGTVSMDYVSGRACKMHTRIEEGRIVMPDSWYDHTDSQLAELLESLGLKVADDTQATEHGPSCNCDECRDKRGEAHLDPQKDFEECLKAHGDGTAFDIKTLR